MTTKTDNTTKIIVYGNTELADDLSLPYVDIFPDNYDFVLFYDEMNRLTLQSKTLGSITIDFTKGALDYRRRSSNIYDAIAKAIGLKKNPSLKILDATAGLARDAFVLASLGCEVTLIEHSPIIAALINDALKRGMQSPDVAEIISRMQLIEIDSIHYMQQLPENEKPDVVYLDPMFPERKKSALVKKEMQILQALLHETDDVALFKIALRTTKNRVVVKRPRLAPPLNNQKADIVFSGKTCRFDVYIHFF